jgi:hypothetical protein
VGQAGAAGDDDERQVTDDRRRDWTGGFLPFVVLAVNTLVLALQKTKHHALLPATETKALWLAEAATVVCVLILRSGWGRDSGWRRRNRSCS